MSGREPAQLATAQRVAGWLRPAWVEVDLSAVTANVAHLCATVTPSAVCAVVKADGYGHGAVPVAGAALAGGAAYLGVALAEEGHELRQAGIEVPVLVLSEPPREAMALVVEDHLTPTIYTEDGLAALLDAAAGARAGRVRTAAGHGEEPHPVPVHLKVDTGMHRVGASPAALVQLARQVASHSALCLEGLFTHLAVADEPGDPFTAEQLDRFERVTGALAAQGIRPRVLHAANSAGALCHPRSRYQMVRPGMAVYGQAPAAVLQGGPLVAPLRPALSFKARVSYCKEVDAGESLSYGLHYRLSERSVVATVPVGYADGVPRRLFMVGGEVLIRGRRRPVVGAVTMDQILVDCGPGAAVRAGDEVVLLGRQGDAVISPWEWAERLGTIAYEVTCALSPRLPRLYTPG
jgi:alanine racemase